MNAKRTAHIYIGCAGWSLSSANADAFPPGGSHLERYAAVLPAVEINSSFYRPHRPVTYERWRDSVPDHFRFSVKMPKVISHEHRLRDSDELLDRFLAEAGQLQHKLGCLLLQLPPSLILQETAAEDFFTALRQRTDVPVACEPRHASWFTEEGAALMERFKIGCVRADPAPVADVSPRGFARTAYIRLHGSPVIYRSRYEPAFIDAVAYQVGLLLADVDTVWCIFDNTAEGAAVPNALSLLERTALIR